MFPRSHSEHLEKSVGEFVNNIPEEVIFKLKTSYRKVTQRGKHSWENEMLL